jgi:hypothetical protein
MLLLIIVGIGVLAVGKLKLTRSIVLTGQRARWYGLMLVVTAIFFGLGAGSFLAQIVPEYILRNPGLRTTIDYALVIGYIVLLALLFREHGESDADNSPQTNL